MPYEFLAAVCRTTVLTMASLLLLALFLLFGSLWAMHTYLLASGQTTYEILKGKAWQMPMLIGGSLRMLLTDVPLYIAEVWHCWCRDCCAVPWHLLCHVRSHCADEAWYQHLIMVQMHELIRTLMHPDTSLHISCRYRGPHSRQVRYSSIWPELMRRWIVGNAPPAPFSERCNMLRPRACGQHL